MPAAEGAGAEAAPAEARGGAPPPAAPVADPAAPRGPEPGGEEVDAALRDAMEERALGDELAAQAEDAGPLEQADSLDWEWVHSAMEDAERFLAALGGDGGAPSTVMTTPRRAGASVAGGDDVGGGGPDDDDDDEWVPAAVLRRRRERGATRYLVQWRGYADPTWADEEELLEAGHGALLRAFQLRQQGRAAKGGRGQGGAPRPLPPAFDIGRYWPDFLQRIDDAFRSVGHRAVLVENICSPARAARFSEEWARLGEAGGVAFPVMVFHGTASHNLQGIIDRGLRIPGVESGIKVANGSANGVGIYSARSPRVPLGFTRGCGMMLCCAGLVTGKFATTTKDLGDVVVFFDERQVLPCCLVHFTYTYANGSSSARAELPDYNSRLRTNFTSVRAQFLQEYAARYTTAAAMPQAPRTIRAGAVSETRRPAWYDRERKTLTKKQLRAEPRSAKEAYKQGLLGTRRSRK